MSHPTTSRRPANRLVLHKAGLSFTTLLLAVMAWWLFLHNLSRANAGPGPDAALETRPASPAAADVPSFDERRFFGPPEDATYSAAVGDMNGDGALDIVVGNRLQQNAVYLNDGAGSFTDARPFGTGTDKTHSVAVGDMNGDGALDIVAGNGEHNYEQQNVVYLNDGAGSFPNTTGYTRTFGTGTDGTFCLAVGDVNGDGALDIIVGNPQEQNAVYLNDGTGSFPNTTGYTRPFGTGTDLTRSVAVGDANSDGALDIIVGNFQQQNIVYLNNGKGDFPATSALMRPFGTGTDETRSVAVGDVNHDSAPDIVVGNDGQQNVVYLNDGAGNFTDLRPFGTELDLTYSVAMGDMNGDGALDIAVGNNEISYGEQNVVYLNDGSGSFSSTSDYARTFGTGTDKTYSVAMGDMNGDGALDIIVGNRQQQNAVYLNDSAGSFLKTGGYTRPFGTGADPTRSVAVGDMNGDGALDIVAGNAEQQGAVYLNDGAGNFPNTGGYTRTFGTGVDNTRSVAVGDMDGDGTLDIVVGNSDTFNGQQNAVYLNNGAGEFPTASGYVRLFGTGTDRTYSLAVGDMDGDGALDIVVGNVQQQNVVYLNDGAGNFSDTNAYTRPFGTGTDNTQSVAVGDINGDGALDVAVGNVGRQNAVYLNDGTGNFPNTDGCKRPFGTGTDHTMSIAVGDMSSDGALDLAVGNYQQQNTVYLNDGAADFPNVSPHVRYFGTGGDGTASVTIGDIDGDGTVDVVVGNFFEQNAVYLNNGSGNLSAARTYGTGIDYTYRTEVGDMNGDGALDLVAGNYNQQNVVYLNGLAGIARLANNPPRVALTRPNPLLNANFAYTNPALRVGTIPLSYTLSDAEGDLVRAIRAEYSPDGGGRWLPAVAAAGTVTTNLATTATQAHVYVWDVFASRFFGRSDNVAFRIEAYPSFTPVTNGVPGPYQRPYLSAQTFPFRVRGTQVRVLSDTVPAANAMVYRLPEGRPTGGSPFADGSGTPFRTDQYGYLQGRGEIGLGDRLFAMLPVSSVLNYAGGLEFDGEDDYVIRNPFHSTPVTETTVSFWMRSEDTAKYGTPLSYAASDSIHEFVIGNYNSFHIWQGGNLVTTGISATDGAWHHIAVTWRSSDGQVRLYKDGTAAYTGTLGAGDTLSPGGSLVLGQDQDSLGGGFEPIQAFEGHLDEISIWNVVLTEAQIVDDMFGIFGRNNPDLVLYWDLDDPDIPTSGQCKDQSGNGNDGTVVGAEWLGDYLGGYTVYHTSAAPTEEGLDAFTVSEPGVQVLTVTAQHPLVLFDIDLSLEWDASNDPVYLQQLELDLNRASKHLYDFSDGQVALGHVNVFQNGDNWASSHVLVHATNRLRPFAAQGGLVISPTLDPEQDDIVYGPGQVHMGATWNRYGTPGQNIGVDWPLILAHELSHYLLFLDDVYIGLDDDGLLVPVDTCTHSAMGDVYDPTNTEFIHDDLHWSTHCTDTLAARTLERDEWETIQLWYPWLVTPVLTNTGPSRMSFDFTFVTVLDPISATDTLEDPTFYLDYADDAVSSSEARAYLLRDADGAHSPPADDFEYVYDLGSPTGGQNRVLARGAQPGDRICVFDRPRAQYGCEVIQDGDEHLALEKNLAWTPVVQLSPVNSTTFGIQVTGLVSDDLSLKARLYPEFGSAFTVTALSYVSTTQAYTATLHLAYPSMVGHVQLWVDEGAEPSETHPRPETIVAFTIGGNPGLSRASGGLSRASGGLSRASGGLSRASGGLSRASGGLSRASGGLSRASGAPLVSPDGQLIFFTENPLIFDVGQFFTVQSMAGLPSLPPGRTLVGQGYNLVASPSITRPITGSISIQYLGSDALVAGVNEDDLSFYFWNGDQWTELDTVLDTTYNLASTPSQGPGVYALLASVRIPLLGAGWNLVSYPLPGSQPITAALRSISGTYAIVYGYVVTDTADPWRVHGVGAPSYVNRLHTLQFGQGYWISVTQPITWYLGQGSDLTIAGDVQAAQDMASPPATFYGPLLAGQGFTPTAGMAMSAWISGKLCGQGRTLEVDDEVVYSAHVSADGPGGASGCGEIGRFVTFRVGSQAYGPAATWDNRRLWELALRPSQGVYLPLILRN